jgi:transposase-like protein
MEQRRQFTREFKLEAVRLVKDRGVSAAQAAKDLGVHLTVLRRWIKDFSSDPQQAFPGNGQMKPEQLEIQRLRKEVTKLKAERDILKKKPRPSSPRSRREVRLRREAPGDLARGVDLRGARCLAGGLLYLAEAIAEPEIAG